MWALPSQRDNKRYNNNNATQTYIKRKKQDTIYKTKVCVKIKITCVMTYIWNFYGALLNHVLGPHEFSYFFLKIVIVCDTGMC